MATPKKTGSNTYFGDFRAYNLAIYVAFLGIALNYYSPGNNQNPAPGVTAELLLNEGTGTTTADGSGNSHPGTLVNSPTWGPGKYGQGLTFNARSDTKLYMEHLVKE